LGALGQFFLEAPMKMRTSQLSGARLQIKKGKKNHHNLPLQHILIKNIKVPLKKKITTYMTVKNYYNVEDNTTSNNTIS
jgi:hypothetical protein